jgi:hypothetical protein
MDKKKLTKGGINDKGYMKWLKFFKGSHNFLTRYSSIISTFPASSLILRLILMQYQVSCID